MSEDEVRRLQSQIHRLEDDERALEERLGYAWRQVEEFRTRLLEGKRPPQAAEAVEPSGGPTKQATLVPVTAAEIDAVLA